MGNKTLSGLWDSKETDSWQDSGNEGRQEFEKDSRREEETSSGSTDYKSAQGESFSDEDKHPSMSSDKKVSPGTEDSFWQNKQEIERKTETRVCTNPANTLKVCYEDLIVDITHPYSLATDLLRQKLISCDIANAMLSEDLIKMEKVVILINAIIESTMDNPSTFNAFIRSLEIVPSHRTVAATLKQMQDSKMSEIQLSSLSCYSNTLVQYSEEMKTRYNCIAQLTSPRNFIFISKQESISTVKNRKLMYSTPAFNRLNKRIIKNDPIDLESILRSPCNCILVESSLVSGRTHLVQHLVSLWNQGHENIKKYGLLVLLDLRKKHVQNINSLWEMFCHPDTSFQQDLLQEVKAAKAKNILIILDGFEHLPATITKNHHSFYSKLVEGKILSKSTKLILGSPQSIRNIIGNYEIFGFLHVELLHSTPIELSKPVNGHAMKSADISIGLLDSSPPSMTQQYICYSLSLLHDYFNGTQLFADITTLDELKANHQVHKSVLFISKLAFMGIVETDFVFDDSLVNNPSVRMGLMKASCTHCNNEMIEYEFLSHTLQEFFAAYFVSQLDNREQNEIFFINSYTEFCGLWKFVAGLCGLTFTMLHTLKSQVYDVHSLAFIVSILYELGDEKAVKFVFEEYSIVSYSHFRSGVSDSKSQYFELGYCVAASSCNWNLNFTDGSLEYEDLQAFIKGIESCPNNTGTIQELQLNFSYMTDDMIQLLSKLNLDNLKNLSMAYCKMTEKCFNSLASTMSFMPKLNSLNISNNYDPCQNLVTTLLSNMVMTSCIKSFHLEGTTLGYNDVVILNTAISMPQSHLVELSVGSESMTIECSHLIVDSTLSHSSLETLRICDLDLTSDNSRLALIESNTNLTHLTFFECQLDVAYLATTLCMNTTLKELNIFFSLNENQYDIGEDDAIALADMLEVNCSLHSVSLYSYREPPIKILKMLETLRYNQTLCTLLLPSHFVVLLSEAELGSLDLRIHWSEWPHIS